MSCAYMQEINLKNYNFQFILLHYLFCYISVSCLTLALEIPVSEFLELCLSVVVSETSSYYIQVILPPHFTKTFWLGAHWRLNCCLDEQLL